MCRFVACLLYCPADKSRGEDGKSATGQLNKGDQVYGCGYEILRKPVVHVFFLARWWEEEVECGKKETTIENGNTGTRNKKKQKSNQPQRI
jgi:hypothetical protein